MPSSSSSTSDPSMRQGHIELLENLPQSILKEINVLLEPHVGDDDDDIYINGNGNINGNINDTGSGNDCHGVVWKLRDIRAAKSAQQKVYILIFGKHKSKIATEDSSTRIKDDDDNDDNNKNNPASFPVLATTSNKCLVVNDATIKLPRENSQQLKLVLRIWQGGSQWWNLNRNEDPRILARAEVEGYRIAGRSIAIASEQRKETASGECERDCFVGLLKIPRVFHFSEGSRRNYSVQKPPQPQQPCWALLEYVGPDEDDRLAYSSRATTSDDHPKEHNPNQNGDKNINKNNSEYYGGPGVFRTINRSYLNGMIKTRTEFGFDEAHPRWGRVPVHQALEYSKIILNEVVLPLHRSSRRLFLDQKQEVPIATKTYLGMVEIFRKAWRDMSTSNYWHHHTDQKARSEENSQKGSDINSLLGAGRDHGDSRLAECLQRLKLVLDGLESRVDATILPPLDPVLVHMDLQPQNLIFCNPSASTNRSGTSNPPSRFPAVFSVLDWEDAAWADPRFDLILLCRKVCANREQANVIWSDYERALLVLASNNDVKNSSTTSIANHGGKGEIIEPNDKQQTRFLGSIELWLGLETVHSITTMLLQSLDLVNGGRNPWETKKDLWGKLQREFTRLDSYKIAQCMPNLYQHDGLGK
uniref:Aminoglycoside phosphotransferase domain-containing protein n=1 Tax=Pseudo-nitzschia australis TaxID=44445 RepID=A0A7S4ANW8_9STRA